MSELTGGGMAAQGYPLLMVVEDDLDLREIYSQLLQHAGFPVISYPDVEGAIAALQGLSEKPKLIILDFMLPGQINGDQFVERMAQLPELGDLPVVLVTAMSSDLKEVDKLRRHPRVVGFFSKSDIGHGKLINFIKSYFKLT